MNIKTLLLLLLTSLITFVSCSKTDADEKNPDNTGSSIFKPLSDSTNIGKWKFKEDLSDEFDGNTINANKWLVQGTNGVFQSNSIGRAPSQYSTKNATVQDGKLKISVKWEPEFAFNSGVDKFGVKYENYTAAAVICKNEFLYGYMEIKCKAADASVSSSFWATGNQSELDIFEHFGKPSIRTTAKLSLETEMWSSIHDWSPAAAGASVWTTKTKLPYRVADGFHVYACEWDKDFIKFFADGKLIKEATRAEIGAGWVLTNPIKLWVNSVTWTWHGLPVKEDLPTSYDIEYIRVWQKN
jgi:beta-glucanase (GH16 family)